MDGDHFHVSMAIDDNLYEYYNIQLHIILSFFAVQITTCKLYNIQKKFSRKCSRFSSWKEIVATKECHTVGENP